MSAEGGTPRRVTYSQARDSLPSWSADGAQIYFTSNRTGSYQLWKIPAGDKGNDGNERADTAAVQITKQGAFESFAAPDGKTIFYSKERSEKGLWRVSTETVAQGTDEMPVPELADAGYWRSWTVTQTGIYYVARAAQPPYQIMRYDFSTNRATEIATTGKTPLWTYPGLSVSPDGKTILYAQQDQNTSSIMLAQVSK